MAQITHVSDQQNSRRSSLLVVCTALFLALLGFAVLVSGYATLLTTWTLPKKAPIAHAAVIQQHVQLHLDIVINQPGMHQDWPAYAPNTLTVPANSLVTVTLHDDDLGDTPLPNGSPFTTVQGTVGGAAYVNGVPYTSLAPDKIAHTFTIPLLHVNVPLPGDGKESDSITFTFRTGKAGTYLFQCFDPCGTGSSGWMGPMMMKGYMVGTLAVQ